MKDDKIKKEKVYYSGPNLILFSLALLLSIFAAYSVGVIVTKKAEEKRLKNNNSNIIDNQNENSYKSIVSSKCYKDTNNNIIYFYDDNTYLLKGKDFSEYGTYEVNKEEVIIYNLFSTNDDISNFEILNGIENIKIDNNYLILYNKNSSGNTIEDKFELQSSNISGSMTNILLKIQKLIDKE